jgi:hypothetical protein
MAQPLNAWETPEADPRRGERSQRELEHNQCNIKGWLRPLASPGLADEFQQELSRRAHLRRPGPGSRR